MKRLAFTTICALAFTGVAFAQGTINWAILPPNTITVDTNTAISPIFGGGGGGGIAGPIAPSASPTFYFELLYNTAFTGSQIAHPASLSALASQWIDTGLEAANSSVVPGRIVPINGNTAAVVLGWPSGIGTLGGTTNNIMLVGWSANLGTSWAMALDTLMNWGDNPVFGNTFFGMSTTGYIVPNTGNPGAMAFATAPTVNGLPINSLNMQLYLIVPEPGTIALVGLGGLSLLWFHRRKSS
jgi:hypothetical protein